MAVEKKDPKDEALQCSCKRSTCARFGDCKACRAHHAKKSAPPYCERPVRRRKTRGKRGEPGDE